MAYSSYRPAHGTERPATERQRPHRQHQQGRQQFGARGGSIFWSGPAGQPDIASIVRYDLQHSGYFSVINPALYPDDPHSAAAINVAQWEKPGH
jgi:Periplasmic component of the Tol biopolymer transport system